MQVQVYVSTIPLLLSPLYSVLGTVQKLTRRLAYRSFIHSPINSFTHNHILSWCR